jgi:hypothetical protein
LVVVINSFNYNISKRYNYLKYNYILNLSDYSKYMNQFILYKQNIFNKTNKKIVYFYLNNINNNIQSFNLISDYSKYYLNYKKIKLINKFNDNYY